MSFTFVRFYETEKCKLVILNSFRAQISTTSWLHCVISRRLGYSIQCNIHCGSKQEPQLGYHNRNRGKIYVSWKDVDERYTAASMTIWITLWFLCNTHYRWCTDVYHKTRMPRTLARQMLLFDATIRCCQNGSKVSAVFQHIIIATWG